MKYKIIIPKEEPKFENSIENSINVMSIANSMFGKKEEPKQDLEKEMFDLEQELDIPSNLRFHNSKPKQGTMSEAIKQVIDNQLKQETLEEAAEKYDENNTNDEYGKSYRAFIEGAKWQQERSYSEEEVLNLLKSFKKDIINSTELNDDFETLVCDIKTNKWFEQFKKK